MQRTDVPVLHLVSCVSKKAAAPAPARDLYLSDWFRKARAFVESQGGLWYILSAKYGLVQPDEIIEPYDRTLRTMPISARKEWAQRVVNQLEREKLHAGKIVVLAGRRYREFLMPALRRMADTVEVPMDGLGIGRQLAWLKEHR
ncbi:MAG: hypothetical protein D6811_12745 [Alphaproteobacteria bacterium]|nr:MAG: hypothetical protein D6811_12745 [Alphaproteobacteria bacterium]